MFEWLEEELRLIRTRKFHIVNSPASAELRRAIEACDLPLPPSYRTFVLRFGNSHLYRYGTNHYISIFAGPIEASNSEGKHFLQIGRTWTSDVFFQESLLKPGHESPVFESYSHSFRKTADGFEAWLLQKAKAARRRYKKKEWQAILAGPMPFTDEEHAIVLARKEFRWRVVGVAPNEDLCIEVSNRSTLILPYLSLGVRGRLRSPNGGPMNGGIYLPIGSIPPGETKLIDFDCYKQYMAPADAEVFDLPDPAPEDRDQYWEFRS